MPSGAVEPEIRPFADGERIAFLGDSITAFNHYIAEVQLYMDCVRGEKAPYFMNCGTAGDGVRGAQDRIDCDLSTMRPDRVIVMLGMNDNAYGIWTDSSYTPAMRQRHERRLKLRVAQEIREDVSLQVIDADQWHVSRKRQSLRRRNADQQSAHKPRSIGHGDLADI